MDPNSLPPLPEGATLDQPQAPPPPPEGATLDAPQGAASQPPPGPPPGAPVKPGYSLPTSWEDAFHRIMGSGLLQTPTPPPTDASGKITDMNPSHMLGAGDVLPNPATGVLAGAAMTGGGMAADTAIHGGSASDIVQNGLIGAGFAVAGGALGAISSATGAVAKAVGSDVMHGVASRAPATVNLVREAVGSAAPELGSTAGAILKAAAQQGPQQAAIAHYLLSQRDPAYAAQQQKKDAK